MGKTFKGCCKYVMGKTGAIVLQADGVRYDNPSNTALDFQSIRELRPSVRNVVIHASLSFSYEDKVLLTNDKMIAVAERFKEKLGVAQHQSICVRHTDAKHDHFHLIINRIGFQAEVASDQFIKNRAARACDELELEFGLIVARGHGINNEVRHRSPKKNNVKDQIKDAIQSGLSSGIKDFNHLETYLEARGIEMRIQYQSTGRVNGLSFKKDEFAFKGSSIDKSLSYRKLVSQLAPSKTPNHIEKLLTKNKHIDYER